jgi:uncharacterized protein YcaQ
MISERRNFQKIYDLTERVLPAHVDTTVPSKEEIGRFFIRRALKALAMTNESEILRFMQPGSARDSDIQIAGREDIKKSLSDLTEAGEAIPVKLEDSRQTYYLLSKTLESVHHPESESGQIYLLSPFDNLIIQRERVRRLFGFDYTLECYVPEAKRKYGYFTLPILVGDTFAGRLDPKADRRNRTFIIRNIIFEPQYKLLDDFLVALSRKLVELAKFNECEKIIIEKTSPAKMRAPLRRGVKSEFNNVKQ